MNKIILTFFIICIFILIVLCVYLYIRGKIEVKAEKKKEKQNAKIDKETIENINIVVSDDVHAGNNVLHQLAEKRK